MPNSPVNSPSISRSHLLSPSANTKTALNNKAQDQLISASNSSISNAPRTHRVAPSQADEGQSKKFTAELEQKIAISQQSRKNSETDLSPQRNQKALLPQKKPTELEQKLARQREKLEENEVDRNTSSGTSRKEKKPVPPIPPPKPATVSKNRSTSSVGETRRPREPLPESKNNGKDQYGTIDKKSLESEDSNYAVPWDNNTPEEKLMAAAASLAKPEKGPHYAARGILLNRKEESHYATVDVVGQSTTSEVQKSRERSSSVNSATNSISSNKGNCDYGVVHHSSRPEASSANKTGKTGLLKRIWNRIRHNSE